MATQRDGFVTRISHDLYRKLVRDQERDPPATASRILDPQRKAARWHWLQEAMQRSIEQAVAEANEHREIAREQHFVLERIELAPQGQEVRRSLDRFELEFNGEARVGWIRRIWPGQARDAIVLDGLREVCLRVREETVEAAVDGDAHERALREKTAPDDAGGLAIRFVGHWERREESAAAPGATGAVQASLLIHDALGQRAAEMRALDLTLGKAGDIRVQGKYVSRQHLRLFVADGRLWAQDAGSTNGVWAGDRRLQPGERREIHDRAELRLGAHAQAPNLGEQECPRVIVTRVVARAADLGATPVLSAAPTPILGGPQQAANPLLTLMLAGSGWRREVPVHRLPFTLGRSHACDYCLAQENEAVSARHLRLLELDLPAGVWVEDMGSTRGCYLAGERGTGRFLLPLGRPLMLGGRSLEERHRPVQLTVLRAERGEP